MSAPFDEETDEDLERENADAPLEAVSSGAEPALPDTTPPEPDDEEEFSLNQLSEAYAKVLRGADSAAVVQPQAIDAGELHSAHPDRAQDSVHRRAVATSPPAPSTVDREARDNAGCPVTPESIVEALVFVGLPGDAPMTLKKIASLLRDVSPKEIKAILKQLNDRYEREQLAYRIKLDGASVRMELDESMLPFQRSFSRTHRGVKLNPATIEVLAVIAYNQPISREKIDETRKRSSSAIVTQLVRRGLVSAVKSEHPDRNLSRQDFITTDKFLELFHLSDLSDLPKGADVSDLDELLS